MRLSNCSTLKPAIAPLRLVRLAVPFKALVKSYTLRPELSIATARLPLPSSRRTPNISSRHCSRSTSENCSCALKSAPAADLASPNVPLTTPPKACDSPTATVRLPSRRLAATAVRPSLAFPRLTRAADSLRSSWTPSKISSAIGLLSVEAQHAFARIPVELDVDTRKGDSPADHVGLRLERKTAEAAIRRMLLAGPAQRVTQRCCIGGKSTLHLERGPVADVAIECEAERCSGQPDLKAGSLALQRGSKIGEADRGVDRLVMPRESAGGGEASGDRGPSKGHFQVRDRLHDFVGLIAQDDSPVGDPDLGKRRRPCGPRFEVLRQRLDVP